MTLPHPEAVVDRAALAKQIALHAQRAWVEEGDAALNPYAGGDLHTDWQLAFERAQASDVLEGSEA